MAPENLPTDVADQLPTRYHPVTATTSPWNQVAPRHYMTVVLCFPAKDEGTPRSNREDYPAISEHIQRALDRLTTNRPDFTRTLISDPDSPDLLRVVEPQIPSPIELERGPPGFDYGFTFRELEEQSFPAHAFVNPTFVIPDGQLTELSLPVMRIRVGYVDGGMLLFVYMHHSYGDGSCMDDFLTLLSSEMAPVPDSAGQVDHDRINVDFDLGNHGEEEGDADFEDLLKKCPEYALLPEPTGPTQLVYQPGGIDLATYKKTMVGKTFVISAKKLGEITSCVNRHDNSQTRCSSFLAIRALVWAHTTKARMACETVSCPHAKPNFTNPYNWNEPRKNLFSDNESLKTYFGNGVAVASATIDSPSILQQACEWKRAMAEHRPPEHLTQVIQEIRRANEAIDEAFVLTRMALIKAAPDIRYLGIAHDPREPYNFSCNTWKFLGARSKFWFPGWPDKGGVRASAIRRVQGEWAIPHGLVLPGRPGIENGDFELLVTLSTKAMELLEKDEEWMSLVSAVN